MSHVHLEIDQVRIPYTESFTRCSAETFRETFQVKFFKASVSKVEFDLIHLATPLANAFRRILISEVPTTAIDKVYILTNTSVVKDEILAHRLGLIPFRIDPTLLAFRKPDEPPTDLNTVVLKLNIECTRNPSADVNETDPAKKYINSTVYASDIKWEPKGDQLVRLGGRPVEPLYPDIIVAKLRPGQKIECESHSEKGIGKIHAKWSPVGTAFYRLLPNVELTRPITGDAAYRLQKLLSPGVIAVIEEEKGQPRAVVVDPRRYTMDREVLRHEEFANVVKLSHTRDHFLFSIESVSALGPAELFLESVRVLKQKCAEVKAALANINTNVEKMDEDDEDSM